MSQSRRVAYIGMGSNLPWKELQPEAILLLAFETLRDLEAHEATLSSLYRTEPVGLPEQPRFLNAVLRLETALGPEALLRALLTVEREFGRERLVQNGPRTLDLDLLLLGDLVLEAAGLTLPHPRLAERRFVLAPLAELAPELLHPVLGRSVAELLQSLPTGGEHRPEAVERLP